MDIEQFFEKLFIKSELADDICRDLKITRKEYSEYSTRLDGERKNEIEEIRRVRSLYHNKRKLKDFDFMDFYSFYNWHKVQFAKQAGKCYYCKTDESVIAKLFETKYKNRKRINRGKHLEIERKNSDSNKYNKENCVLACYFCNNDKSDIFNEYEYLEYLKDRKEFLTRQFNDIK